MFSYYFKAECTFIILLAFINVMKLEKLDRENKTDDEDESITLESKSDELFNSSPKEKPIRYNKKYNEKNDNNDDLRKSLVTCKDYMKLSNEIKGNDYLSKSKYSYLVSIQKKGSHYATGALVNSKWILTVAGQFYNVRESIKLLKVRLGSINCKKGGIIVALKEILIHPDYVYGEPNFDLALLRIAHPVKFSAAIKPINLSNVKGQIKSAKFLTSYWPRLIIKNKLLPFSAKERVKKNSLRVSPQKMISQERCFDVFDKFNYSLDTSTLCLEPIVSRHSPCTPDAGAPVIADDGLLWGITSGWISNDCLKNPSPTIFNRISLAQLKSWLNEIRQ